MKLERQGLAIELLQKRFNFIWRRWGKLKNRPDLDVRKAQARETRAERFADLFARGARHFRECLKNDFVIGIDKCMGSEAFEDCGTCFALEARRAKCCEQLPLDFRSG